MSFVDTWAEGLHKILARRYLPEECHDEDPHFNYYKSIVPFILTRCGTSNVNVESKEMVLAEPLFRSFFYSYVQHRDTKGVYNIVMPAVSRQFSALVKGFCDHAEISSEELDAIFLADEELASWDLKMQPNVNMAASIVIVKECEAVMSTYARVAALAKILRRFRGLVLLLSSTCLDSFQPVYNSGGSKHLNFSALTDEALDVPELVQAVITSFKEKK